MEIKPSQTYNDVFFAIWVSKEYMPKQEFENLGRFFHSLLTFHRSTRIYLFTRPESLSPSQLEQLDTSYRHSLHLVHCDMTLLLTKVAQNQPSRSSSSQNDKAALENLYSDELQPRYVADIFRVAALFLWGGSYVDCD